MKELSGDLLRSTTVIKVLAFVFLAVAFFYFGKHWSDGSSQQLLFFNSRQNPSEPISPSAVSLSSNFNKTFDLSTVINDTNKQQSGQVSIPPPPPPAVQNMGLLDENGVMKEDFAVGDYDPDVVENWPGVGNETDLSENNKVVKVKKFGLCPESMREYIPCLDNVEAIQKLNSTEKGDKFERHCPEKDKGLNCLVPAPRGYQTPIPWPRSRDEVCYSLPKTLLISSCIEFFFWISCSTLVFLKYLLSHWHNVLLVTEPGTCARDSKKNTRMSHLEFEHVT